jgi:hypothetical protein
VASCAPSDNILSSADDAESGGSRSQIIANALRSRTEHNEPSGAPGVADVGAAAAAAGATGDGSCQRLAWLSAVDTATDRAISEFSQRFAPELHALSLLVGATSLNAPFVNEPLSGGSASVEWAEARVGWSRCMVSVHAERVHTNVQTEGYASTHKNTRARAHTHTHTHTHTHRFTRATVAFSMCSSHKTRTRCACLFSLTLSSWKHSAQTQDWNQMRSKLQPRE